MSLKIKGKNLQILPLESIKDSNLRLVGHKSLNLSRLKRAGFQVPNGMVITSKSVHDLHLDQGKPLPEETQKILLDIFYALNASGKGVAIRSSGVGEDSADYSFAGEFVSVLNVNSPTEFLAALTSVAQSLHSKVAEEYSTHAHLHETGMAILVQEMIQGSFSGIAFSESLDSDHQGQVIIEAVQGLGDKLASGIAESDHAIVSKDNFSILEHINSKILTPNVLRSIAKIAVEIESFFGKPQDIEFTFFNNEFWILQSRPITASSTTRKMRNEFDSYTNPKEWWSSHNAQEVLPGIICPLSCSFMNKFVNKSVKYAYGNVWYPSDRFDLFGIFFQRSYINMTAMKIISERVLGADADEIIDQYLGQKHHNVKIENPDPFFKKNKIKFLNSPGFIYKTVFALDEVIDKTNKEVDQLQNYLSTVNWKNFSNEEVWAEVINISKIFEKAFANHLLSGAAIGMPIKYLENIIASLSKENCKNDVNTLLSGLKNIVSSQITLNIWDLSRIAKKEKLKLDNQFLPQDPKLPNEWRSAFSRFIENYGHRCENEWDTRAISWRQNPTPLIQMIHAYTLLEEKDSPYLALEKTAHNREELTKSLSDKMPYLKRKIFHYCLTLAQKSMARRELTKSYGVKSTRLLEYPLNEIGDRLASKGFIDTPEDIFFLTLKELKESLINPNSSHPLKANVIERKREFEANKYLELPENFQGYPIPFAPREPSKDKILKGYSINDKTVTGPARIIHNVNQGSQLQPGEIIVTPTMDIALTPLFPIASGVVVDIGGMLSHGCIIAREFGLPGIINVKEGTRKIKNGDLLTIDGKQGAVFISSDEKH